MPNARHLSRDRCNIIIIVCQSTLICTQRWSMLHLNEIDCMPSTLKLYYPWVKYLCLRFCLSNVGPILSRVYSEKCGSDTRTHSLTRTPANARKCTHARTHTHTHTRGKCYFFKFPSVKIFACGL